MNSKCRGESRRTFQSESERNKKSYILRKKQAHHSVRNEITQCMANQNGQNVHSLSIGIKRKIIKKNKDWSQVLNPGHLFQQIKSENVCNAE